MCKIFLFNVSRVCHSGGDEQRLLTLHGGKAAEISTCAHESLYNHFFANATVAVRTSAGILAFHTMMARGTSDFHYISQTFKKSLCSDVR